MNPRRNAIAAWDFSRWFAVLSPLIGVLLGFVGAFFVLHWKERIWDECNRSQTLSREWQEHTAERFIRSGAPNGPPLPQGMVSLDTSPARSDARVQHVGLQFGKGSGMHLRFVCAARECLAMKRTTFPPVCLSHGTSWSCLTDQSQQRERQLRTAPATHGCLCDSRSVFARSHRQANGGLNATTKAVINPISRAAGQAAEALVVPKCPCEQKGWQASPRFRARHVQISILAQRNLEPGELCLLVIWSQEKYSFTGGYCRTKVAV